MPYIKDEHARKELDDVIFTNAYILQPKGNLNYFICKLFLKLMRVNGGISYNKAGEFIKELEMAKMEIYRRWVAPYEDDKKEENGDLE